MLCLRLGPFYDVAIYTLRDFFFFFFFAFLPYPHLDCSSQDVLRSFFCLLRFVQCFARQHRDVELPVLFSPELVRVAFAMPSDKTPN